MDTERGAQNSNLANLEVLEGLTQDLQLDKRLVVGAVQRTLSGLEIIESCGPRDWRYCMHTACCSFLETKDPNQPPERPDFSGMDKEPDRWLRLCFLKHENPVCHNFHPLPKDWLLTEVSSGTHLHVV